MARDGGAPQHEPDRAEAEVRREPQGDGRAEEPRRDVEPDVLHPEEVGREARGPQAEPDAVAQDRVALADVVDVLSVVPANPADTGKVSVAYLDSSYRERVARFDLSGGPASTDEISNGPIAARRVNSARYIGGGNLGVIDINIGGALVNRIGVGDGLARVCLFTVPYGQPTVLDTWHLSAPPGAPVEIRLRVRLPGREPYTFAESPARETLESAYGDGLVYRAAAAGGLAGRAADAPAERGERIGAASNQVRLFGITLGDGPDVTTRVGVHGAGELALDLLPPIRVVRYSHPIF